MMHEGKIITATVAADMANPAFERASARILIVRLSPIRDVEVSYSHLVLFDETRRALPDAFIDFAFLPIAPDRKLLNAKRGAWFFGRASGKYPSEFDIILVSCSFTLELVNLPWLFVQSGIPTSRRERLCNSKIPFVFLGGSSAVTSGALLQISEGAPVDSLVDAIFFGEGEGRIAEIVRIATEGQKRSETKQVILAEIAAQVKGFWPCSPEWKTERSIYEDRPAMLTRPLVLNGEYADHAKLAITAGCTGHCSFCLEGWDRRPFREKPFEELRKAALALKKATGASDLELFSYNFNMHHEILNIIPAMGRYFMHVSLMSQRIDLLARIPHLPEAEFAAGKRSFTFGIEGISARMRQYYHKGISDEQIADAIYAILNGNARELKLFFIISGYENKTDFDELHAFFNVLGSFREQTRASTRIIVSAGYLVRLPFTPLQFAPLAYDRTDLERISATIESLCKEYELEYRMAASFEDYWTDQLLSLAGPLAHEWLCACTESGFVYDTHIPRQAATSLDAFLKSNKEFPALLQEKASDYRPCFSFIESEAHWNLLYAHYEGAASHLESSHVLKNQPNLRNSHSQIALQQVSIHTEPTITSEKNRVIQTIAALMEAKSRFQPFLVRIREDSALAFSTRAYESSWLIRALSALVPNAERVLFECRQIVPGNTWDNAFSRAGIEYGVSGEKWFALYGPDFQTIQKIVDAASRKIKVSFQSGQRMAGLPSAFLLALEPQENNITPEECMLSFSLPQEFSSFVGPTIEKWLEMQNVHFTSKKIENGHEYLVAPSSQNKKVLASAEYHTSSSHVFATMRIGKRADMLLFSDYLGKAVGDYEFIFNIEYWI
jgi:radical SAM superfamily enzyme YgiQ (UPF0313 family)